MVALLTLALVAGSGCGSSGSESTPEAGGGDQWNQEYVGVAISEGDGGEVPIAEPGDVHVSFEKSKKKSWMGWTINCNSFGADLKVEGRRVWASQAYSTAMGCPGGEEEDAWLTEFFEAGPEWRLQGRNLVLAAAGDKVELAPEKVPSDG